MRWREGKGRDNRIFANLAGRIPMYMGTYENKIDSKGRVSLPAGFRANLPEAADRIINIFPSAMVMALNAVDPDYMVDLMGRISASRIAGEITSEQELAVKDKIFGSVKQTRIDENGRIMLPDELAAAVGITSSVVFVGLGEGFHIRSPEHHRAYVARTPEITKGIKLDQSLGIIM